MTLKTRIPGDEASQRDHGQMLVISGFEGIVRGAGPTVSPHLDHSLRYTVQPHPDLGLPKWYPAHVVVEAGRVLAALAPLFAPVTERQLRRWLVPVVTAVPNVPDADGINGFVSALMITLTAERTRLPACCLSEQSLASFLSSLRWWPSTGELYEHLRAGVADAIRTREALDRIAAFQPKQRAA